MVPNQRKMKISRSSMEVKTNYLKVSNENLLAAMKAMNAGELKLYLYLLSNKDGYTFEFSPTHIATETEMSRQTIHNAFNSLVENKYIIKINGNGYVFHETPQMTAAEVDASFAKPFEEYTDEEKIAFFNRQLLEKGDN